MRRQARVAKTEELSTSLWRLANFTPKQAAAWQAFMDYGFLLYGGARGGGKSYLLRWAMLLYLVYVYQHFGLTGVKVAIFCEDYPTLTDRQITWIVSEFPTWAGKLEKTQADGLGFRLSSELGGGVILLRNLDKPAKYRSSQWAAVAVDELTMSPYDVFAKLNGSKRWPGLGFTKFVGTTNPGGIGHAYVKDFWIDRKFATHPEWKPRAEEFVFVPALLDDNPYLDPSYRKELEIQSEQIRKAWLEGSWDVFEGQFFAEWNPLRHVIDPIEGGIPDYWIKRRAVDQGYTAPWCTLFSATDPETGRVIVYREIYGTRLTDTQQAKIIVAHSPANEVYRATFGDPSMWAKKNVAGIVRSSADEYARGGVPMLPGDNDRHAGWRKIHRALANLSDGMPGLQVYRNCTNLIRTLPALTIDDVDPEDIMDGAEDHPPDTLRYLLSDLAKQPEQGDNTEAQARWEHKQRNLGRRFGGSGI